VNEADDWCRKALAIEVELGNRRGMARIYHQLGMNARDRRRLDEAEEWFHDSLAISEELGNGPYMALTCAQLGLLAEDRTQPRVALAWNVRCVTLFDEFPSRLTGTGPSAVVRLARELGMPALEETWRQVTGQPLPQQVRDYVASQPGEATEAHT